MIPETPFITITAHLKCLGKFVCEIHGRAYCLDNSPQVDVVTWITDDDEEVELSGMGTPMEDEVYAVLKREAKQPINLSRLQEEFRLAVARSAFGAETANLRMVG